MSFIGGKGGRGGGGSPAETPECWTLQVQTEAIFANSLPYMSKLSANLEKYSANMAKLSANMASVWNCRLQHSGVSAELGGRDIIERNVFFSTTFFISTIQYLKMLSDKKLFFVLLFCKKLLFPELKYHFWFNRRCS